MSKQAIQDRMRKFAAELIGIRHTELLDPVMNLFLESLSEEAYKLSGEIENIENRISDKLASILAPSIDTIAHPAHCILHVSPQEGTANITTDDGFAYYAGDKKKQLSFYPVCNNTVFNGKVCYFIHKGLIHSMDYDLSKTLHSRSDCQSRFDDSTCWMALDLDDCIQDLCGLSFFFDLQAIMNKHEYLNLLPYSTWTINGERIPITKGLSTVEKDDENDTLRLFSRYDLSHRINRSVIKHYHNHFISISGACPVEDKKEEFPEELKPYFSQTVLSKMNKPLVWIKMVCPKGLSSDVIYSLQPGINLFPVVNRELASTVVEVSKAVPIIPLKTECNESFIDVNKVVDAAGVEYYDIPVSDLKDGKQVGIYSLRRGGIERYNKRDAGEYLADIIHALNAETSSFSKNKENVKSDFVKTQNDIKQLMRQLNKTQTNSQERYEVENYLLVNPTRDDQIYFVDYWITDAEEANHLKAGIPFVSLSALMVNPLSLVSVTPTIGGKYAPQAERKNELRKKTLTEHGLLVTDQDIINFCLQEFKESIREVKIRKGIMYSSNPKLGFIRTIDVYMALNKNMVSYVDKKDAAYFREALVKNSPATYNYRVFIEQTLSN